MLGTRHSPIVGGASQNAFLNRLTQQATGLEVFRGAPESSTVGNFAVQLATLEGSRDPVTGAYAEPVARWAGLFVEALHAGLPVVTTALGAA